jgi:hypothetical protein
MVQLAGGGLFGLPVIALKLVLHQRDHGRAEPAARTAARCARNAARAAASSAAQTQRLVGQDTR